jgi:phosphoribosylglycinamide formyltransferase-1
MSEIHIPRVAILASGGGTTAEAYAQAIHNGQVNHNIGLVIASNKDAKILERVTRWNSEFGFDTESTVINHETHPRGKKGRGQTLEESEAIAELLRERGVGLVATLGYMKIINGALMDEYGYHPKWHQSAYEARMINTHPGPLPETTDTYGDGAAAKVLELGLDESKHTVHVVSQGVDEGPIIVAHPVPILPGDTKESLNERTQWIEKATIAYALDKFLKDQQTYRQEIRGFYGH